MRILVCVKRVPAPGAKINIAGDGLAVDTAHLGFTTSPHEECAVEEAVQIVEAHGGEVTVLTLGPADAGGFQVGVRVAHALGRPIVNGIKGIDVGDGSVTARREIDGGFEVYEVPTPAVLGVKEGINLPRYPTMKGRLASKKAALATVEQPTEAGGQERLRLHRPVEQVSETVILGEGPEAAAAVVDVLEELGVLA